MQKQILSQKKIIIPLIIVIVLAILYIAAKPALDRRNNSRNNSGDTQQNGTGSDSDTVSPAPTDSGDDQKDRNLDRDKIDQTPTPTPGGTDEAEPQKTTVNPVITYAGQQGSNLEVGATINGIYEGGGTCTLTVSNGSYTYTKQQQAIKNATTTDCQYFIVPVSEIIEKGAFTVGISYESPAAKGSSDQKEVTIQ